jgi:hypothetical protein
MGINDPKNPKVVTVTDEQIVTERKHPRRSFLTATGALLAGAAAIVSGARAATQDKKKEDEKAGDPDTKKAPAKKAKAKKATGDKKPAKQSDPDKK